MSGVRSASAARALVAAPGCRRPGAAAAAAPCLAAARWLQLSRSPALTAQPPARQQPARQRGAVQVQAAKAAAAASSSTVAGAAVTSWFKATGVPLLEAMQQLTLQQVGCWGRAGRVAGT